MNMNRSLLRPAFLALVIAFAPWFSRAQTNTAQPPGQISYQGFLTDGSGIPLATNTPQNFNVLFNIYPVASGGAALWGESQVVTVDRGFFTVLLGVGSTINGIFHTNDLTYLFNTNNAQTRYIGLTVQGLGTGEISPRLQLLSAPYALLAANAVNALNVTGSNIISAANLSTNIGVWSVSGPNVYRAGGSVGIGTASPTAASLEVAGDLRIDGNRLLFDGGSGTNDGLVYASGWPIPGGVGPFLYGYLGGALGAVEPNVIALSWDYSGNVWVSNRLTTSTLTIDNGAQLSEKLRLSGEEFYQPGFTSADGIAFLLGVNRVGDRQLWIADSAGEGVSAVNGTVRIIPGGAAGGVIDSIATDGQTYLPLHLGNSGNTMTLNTNGFVGIGTRAPAAPLDVEGYNNISGLTGYYFYNGFGSWNTINNGTVSTTIKSQYFVNAYGFSATSDRRIKDIIGQADTRKDLQTIEDLQVTDYRMKDRAVLGDKVHKGFIAQEVQAVIPEAVNQDRGFIPNIYARAERLQFDAGAKTLRVSMAKAHGLQVGDRVRLITDGASLEQEVSEVSDEDTFVLAGVSADPKRAFVYGKQVNDFLSVDYNRIFSTGISAIQELAKRVEKLEARESHLAALEEKSARVATLEQEVTELKKMVAQLVADGKGSKQTAGALAPVQPARSEALSEGTITTASLGR